MKNSVKLSVAVLAATLLSGIGSFSLAANLAEFRDKNNVFAVFISTPANELDGANLDASDVNRGTLPNARLDSTSVTLQGNTFNAANKLVQLDGSTKLPAVDGSNLTNVTATTIGADSVGTTQIINSTITAADMGTDSVAADEIAADAVGSSEIAADAVGSSEIAADAVGPSELAATAVTAASYGSATQAGTFTVDADGRLTAAASVTVTPAAASITAGSLGATVIASSIAINAVGADQIQTDAVGSSEIAADAVGSSEIAADAVSTSEIATDGVGAAEIAADAVSTSEIATDGVGSAEIAADAVGPSELAATAVTAASYGSATQVGTFTVDADGRLTAASNTTVTPAAGSVSAGTFSGSFTFSSALTVNGLDMRGALSAATLQATACAAHATVPCMAFNSTDSDLYTSTGTATGSWRNSRTGVAP